MIYIKEIIINNFQSHVNTHIKLSAGLNTFIGQSDSGKTAIIRALKWLFYNEPKGEQFKRSGSKEVSVTVLLSNGKRVTRGRSATKNYYILDDGKNIQRFENFGTQVPEEIKNATGIDKVNIDGNNNLSLNIAEQLEGAFYVDLSESVRANALAKLVDAHYIDYALKSTLKDKRNDQNDIRFIQTEIDRLILEKIKYEKALKYKKILNKINEKKAYLDENVNKYNLLLNLNTIYLNLKKEILIQTHIYDRVGDIEKVHVNTRYLTDLYSKLNDLYMMKNSIQIIINHKYQMNCIIIKAKDLNKINKETININNKLNILNETKELKNIFSTVTTKIDNYATINNKLGNLNYNVNSIEEINRQITLLNNLASIKNVYTTNSLKLSTVNKYLTRTDCFNDISNKQKILSTKLELKSKLIKLKLSNNECRINIDKIKNDYNKSIDIIDTLSNKYNNILLKLNYCPTCFRPISQEDCHDIKSKL